MIQEYIVTKDILNIRSKVSDEKDETYRGYFIKGTKVWVYEDDIIGIVPKGGETNLWKQITGSENVVAKDGIKLTKEREEINYQNFLTNLNFEWLQTKGIGTIIGLIDTGITANKDFYNNFKEDIFSNTDNISFHGNFIGGILAGKKSIIGIAKDTILYSIKFKSDRDDTPAQLNNFIKALKRILELDGSVILNISQQFNPHINEDQFKIQKQEIIGLLQQISAQNNKLLICAAADNSAINNMAFPGSMNECISVGCIDEFSKEVKIEVKLNILTPMFQYTSFDNSFNQIQKRGSSFSTAIISALAACYMSKHGSITKDGFLAELKKSSSDRKDFKYGKIQAFQYQLQ